MNSQSRQKTFNLLSICIKAGRAVMGFDSVCACVKEGRAFCVMTVSDVSEKTLKETKFICEKYNVPVLETELTKADTMKLTGKETAVIAVCDRGFAEAFMKF